MYQSSDEISLRELYLIFRSGLVAIIITTVLVGAAAYLYLATRPSTYEASAIVQVAVPQVPASSAEAAWILRPGTIGVTTYRSIANSVGVLAATFGVAEDDVEELSALSKRLELEVVESSNQAQGRFTVEHVVNDTDPLLAAQRANAWADATVRAVTAAIGRSVAVTVTSATSELNEREQELKAARAEWTAFADKDERSELSSRLSLLRQMESQASLRVAELENLLAAARAQYTQLATTAQSSGALDRSALEVQVDALLKSGALDSETAQALEQALTAMPPGLTLQGQELTRLVTRTRLENLASTIAGYAAELDSLKAHVGDADGEASALRKRTAELAQEAAQLEQRLNAAQSAYDSVADMAPLIRLQQGMLENAASVIAPATRPIEASSNNRLTITLAAALVAGLLATLAVFLRAAVREPDAPAGSGSNRPVSHIDQSSGDLRTDRSAVAIESRSRGEVR